MSDNLTREEKDEEIERIFYTVMSEGIEFSVCFFDYENDKSIQNHFYSYR